MHGSIPFRGPSHPGDPGCRGWHVAQRRGATVRGQHRKRGALDGRVSADRPDGREAVRETPDITLAELRERLIAERGETFALSTIHDFYRRHGITFKKRRRTPASRRARM